MSSVSFLYVESSNDETEAFKAMRRKHMQEESKFDDNFYLTRIFEFLSEIYDSFTVTHKRELKGKTEEEITDCVRRKLQKNADFVSEGFRVNSEARNQDKIIGYYDLKFENGSWANQYLVLECKPVDISKSKLDAYVYKTTYSVGQDGGLYRFLINKYATGKAFGGMLGYIISGDPQKVVAGLKAKIQTFQIKQGDLCFGDLLNRELLDAPIANFNYSFQSNHTRICRGAIIDSIHMFHLFFDLTK